MLLRGILATKDAAIGCDDCYELLDRYADLIEAGGDLEQIYPQVKAHLEDCGGCSEEFDALLTALRALPRSS